MSLIKVVPYVLGMTPGVPGAPESRMYPRSVYFLVLYNSIFQQNLAACDIYQSPRSILEFQRFFLDLALDNLIKTG